MKKSSLVVEQGLSKRLIPRRPGLPVRCKPKTGTPHMIKMSPPFLFQPGAYNDDAPSFGNPAPMRSAEAFIRVG
jgi:hypothetical protein